VVVTKILCTGLIETKRSISNIRCKQTKFA